MNISDQTDRRVIFCENVFVETFFFVKTDKSNGCFPKTVYTINNEKCCFWQL